MKPALGVTEIGAIALACATAFEAVEGTLQRIKVTTDPGLFKNTFSCMVPGTDEMGSEIAAILGVLAGDPDLGLKVLNNIKEADIEKAKKLRDQDICDVDVKKGFTDIFVDAKVTTSKGVGRAIIKNSHENIVRVTVNGEAIYDSKVEREQKEHHMDVADLTLSDFKEFADKVPFEEINFVLDSIPMNKQLAHEGGKLGIGEGIADLEDSTVNYAQLLTAKAVDARLSGIPKPAMSIAGSGSHGIIATMPLAAVAEREHVNEEKLARAIALSYLVTLCIKEQSGKLSAFCGCAIAAGTGASAGVTYLLEGGEEEIGYAVNNMAGNITGMICDGGNLGCALKAMTGASAAVKSALFALKDITIPPKSGIVGDTVEETMENMGTIASLGMVETDEVILGIMLERKNQEG